MNKSAPILRTGSVPLAELFESFRTWGSTKPVDKVYALLGSSSDASDVPELQPDYTIPQDVLAQSLVQSAFPDCVLSPHSTNK